MFDSVITGRGIATNGMSGQPPSQSGAVYWDSAARSFLIIDSHGIRNQFYHQTTMIQLDQPTIDVLQWASQKMIEEAELKALCEQHPGLKDTKEKFDVMLALVRQKE